MLVSTRTIAKMFSTVILLITLSILTHPAQAYSPDKFCYYKIDAQTISNYQPGKSFTVHEYDVQNNQKESESMTLRLIGKDVSLSNLKPGDKVIAHDEEHTVIEITHNDDDDSIIIKLGV